MGGRAPLVHASGRVIGVLDSGAEGHAFKSQSRRCRVTVLGKLSHPSCLCSASSETGSSPLKSCEGNQQAWLKVMAAYRLVYYSRHLQADCQLRNPTLGNRVWATFLYKGRYKNKAGCATFVSDAALCQTSLETPSVFLTEMVILDLKPMLLN